MNISPSTLYTTLGATFTAILGCYVYVFKYCSAVQHRTAALEREVRDRIARLEIDLVGQLSEFKREMTDRLARLDTKMDFMLDRKDRGEKE